MYSFFSAQQLLLLTLAAASTWTLGALGDKLPGGDHSGGGPGRGNSRRGQTSGTASQSYGLPHQGFSSGRSGHGSAGGPGAGLSSSYSQPSNSLGNGGGSSYDLPDEITAPGQSYGAPSQQTQTYGQPSRGQTQTVSQTYSTPQQTPILSQTYDAPQFSRNSQVGRPKGSASRFNLFYTLS